MPDAAVRRRAGPSAGPHRLRARRLVSSELARQAAGFAADPPVVAITAVAAAYGLTPSVTSRTPDQLATLAGPSVAIVDGVPLAVAVGRNTGPPTDTT